MAHERARESPCRPPGSAGWIRPPILPVPTRDASGSAVAAHSGRGGGSDNQISRNDRFDLFHIARTLNRVHGANGRRAWRWISLPQSEVFSPTDVYSKNLKGVVARRV